MRKIVAIAAFLLSLSTINYAQESLSSNLRLGFQLSPTFTWLSTDNARINNNGTNLGIKLQVLGEKYFQENYAITIGLGFAFNQGGTLKYDEAGRYWPRSIEEADYPFIDGVSQFPAGVNLKSSIQYVEIPVGLKLRTKEFGYLRYFVEPQFILGIQTQARGTAKGNADFDGINIKNDINALGLSWGLGAGGEYGISEKTAILFGLYYQNIFTDVTSDKGPSSDPNNSDDESKASLNGLTIRLGVLF